MSKRKAVALLLLVLALALVGGTSRKYVRLFLSRNSHQPHPKIDGIAFAAQNANDPHALLEEANRLSWLFNWPKAGPLYARAEELSKANHDARNEIYARVGRIRAQSETMSYADVSQMIQVELSSEPSKADPSLRLWCLVQKGYTDLEISAADAKRDWLEAREIAQRLGEKQWEARAEGELGIIAFLEGDSKHASTMVGDSLLSAMASGDLGGQVRALEMLGNGFNEVRRYGEALAFFDRAIKRTADNPDCGFPYMAYEGKGLAQAGEGKFDEAENTLDFALSTAVQNQKYGHQSQLLIEKGELALQTGHLKEAIQDLERAGDLGREHAFYRMAAQAMFDLANIYRDQGDLRAAEDRASIGIEVSRRVGDRYFLPRDFTVLANLKERQGETETAERLFVQAEDVIDGMLINTNEAYWNSSLADAMSDTYLLHFEMETRLGNVARAFSVLERVRGRTAAALLENKTVPNQNESDQVRQLESGISTLQLRLMRSEDAGERAALLDQLVESERRLGLARTGQETNTKEWFEEPASPRAVQSRLRTDEVILEYVLAEPRSYCLWISTRDVGVATLSAGRKEIEDSVRTYLKVVRDKQNDLTYSQRLYAVLLSPFAKEKNLSRLVIVPDGILHLLPFETLTNSSGALVLQDKIVSYSPASTVLYVLRGNSPKSNSSQKALLAVGNAPYQNQANVSAQMVRPAGIRDRLLRGVSDTFGATLYDLPETRDEVLDIDAILQHNSTLLLGSQATETAFKSERLTNFKIIHLAVHGFADSRFPERSGVVLGLDPKSQDDGLLQVREIKRLRFDADLVTLSACDTGIGKLQGEEGVTDLAEAFLLSGSRSVVASLWSADDTFTHALMDRFYTHIASGDDQASALRNAKLDLLEKYGKTISPYYWGAFVLTGDGASPIRLDIQ